MDDTLKLILEKLEHMATKEDIAATNARLDTMQDSIDTLKQDMAHHNHYVEPLLKGVKDGVDGIMEHNQQLDRLENKVDGHDHRIWALEQRKAQ